jgi:hypothetical protein
VIAAHLAGRRPTNIPEGISTLGCYQPLVAAANESTKVGPTLTEANMSYDGTDHPSLFGYPAYAYAQS